MKCILVSHTHWDREWYRTFQQFRARLIDTIDEVLALSAGDPGYRFLLDGQSVVLEDYLEIRPERRSDLEQFIADGQIAVGPWYVQPDSLLPSGEAHVRNLLEGRRVAQSFGPASRIAYTPDSFGHPAQFPQLFAGFGMRAFVYSRGSGAEIDSLPSEYRWQAPDGTEILACHLAQGYFAAAHLESDVHRAAERLRILGDALAQRASGNVADACVLLMNGVDHAPPDRHTAEVVDALASATGWDVQRGLLDDFVAGIGTELPAHRGELVGGRLMNLLPGVWSARTDLKLRNRACEALLEGWAEPVAAIGRLFGLADERPALRIAWRHLLQNQAHDSIGGCSIDRVHAQMLARYDAASELAEETTARTLERLAGLPVRRVTSWSEDFDVAVFNPSPHVRTDRVRVRIDPVPAIRLAGTAVDLHPLLGSDDRGYTADGEPARVLASPDAERFRLFEDTRPIDVEVVARDVPAFGWKRIAIRRSTPDPDAVDGGREIAAGKTRVTVRDDGTLDVSFGGRTFERLAVVEDTGDRGDTYDFDPVGGGEVSLQRVAVERRRHASGMESVGVSRWFRMPSGLSAGRRERSAETAEIRVDLEARVTPGVGRVDLDATVDNGADDHRLRLCFPTGSPAETFTAASTFDVVTRRPGPADGATWVHPAPATFPHQGWISVNELTVAAPGLYEGEVRADGTIAITLLRAVGMLARFSLETRPIPAGPTIPTPAAQRHGRTNARLSLFPGIDARTARDAELGLAAVFAGDAPLLADGQSLLRLAPDTLVLTAFKPAADGQGTILRILNPTDAPVEAEVFLGFPLLTVAEVRLDETPVPNATVPVSDGRITFELGPHALRTFRVA